MSSRLATSPVSRSVGLLDGLEQVGPVVLAERHVRLAQARRRRLDARQRGAQVVRDRREQGGARAVVLGEDLGLPGQLDQLLAVQDRRRPATRTPTRADGRRRTAVARRAPAPGCRRPRRAPRRRRPTRARSLRSPPPRSTASARRHGATHRRRVDGEEVDRLPQQGRQLVALAEQRLGRRGERVGLAPGGARPLRPGARSRAPPRRRPRRPPTKTSSATRFWGSLIVRVLTGSVKNQLIARLPRTAAASAGHSPPTRAVSTVSRRKRSTSSGRSCHPGVARSMPARPRCRARPAPSRAPSAARRAPDRSAAAPAPCG